MRLFDGQDYPNVAFQSAHFSFDELCEKRYLAGILSSLKEFVGASFEDYRFIVYAGVGGENVDLSAADPCRTIVLYVSDESGSIPADLCKKVRAVFKNYLPREHIVSNLYSLPLGYVESTRALPSVPVNRREQDVFFSGNLNGRRTELFRVVATPQWWPVLPPRRVLVKLRPSMEFRLTPKSRIRFTREFCTGMSGDEYGWYLANSKLALCPRGFSSSETFRHFEAMRAGAIVLSRQLPPLDIYAQSPIVQVDGWRNLRKLVRDLLDAPDRLAELQERTLAWWQSVCSEAAVAGRIADVLG